MREWLKEIRKKQRYSQREIAKMAGISQSYFSKGLHTMAQQSKIAVVALSQLNRAGDSEPTMINLRESGQIEQDADAILFLHRSATGEDTDDQERKLIIAKNKEGQCGYIKFRFDGDMQRFFAVGEPEEGSAPPF